MTWQPRERWRNETMMLGPHKLLGHLQQEFNQLGMQDPPWCIHGWEHTHMGWVGCAIRSVEIKPGQDA